MVESIWQSIQLNLVTVIGTLPKMEKKSKAKRLEEKEKIDAETQRSLAVAQSKQAHKKIEDIEKSRKYPALLSVCERINDCNSNLLLYQKMLGKVPFAEKPIFDEDLRKSILFWGKIYESISYDFQKILGINDLDMEKLFPKIDMIEESGWSISNCFNRMNGQLYQMALYCRRYWF